MCQHLKAGRLRSDKIELEGSDKECLEGGAVDKVAAFVVVTLVYDEPVQDLKAVRNDSSESYVQFLAGQRINYSW